MLCTIQCIQRTEWSAVFQKLTIEREKKKKERGVQFNNFLTWVKELQWSRVVSNGNLCWQMGWHLGINMFNRIYCWNHRITESQDLEETSEDPLIQCPENHPDVFWVYLEGTPPPPWVACSSALSPQK